MNCYVISQLAVGKMENHQALYKIKESIKQELEEKNRMFLACQVETIQ